MYNLSFSHFFPLKSTHEAKSLKPLWGKGCETTTLPIGLNRNLFSEIQEAIATYKMRSPS